MQNSTYTTSVCALLGLLSSPWPIRKWAAPGNRLSRLIMPVGRDFYQTNGCVAVQASFAGSYAPQLWRGFVYKVSEALKPEGRLSTYV